MYCSACDYCDKSEIAGQMTPTCAYARRPVRQALPNRSLTSLPHHHSGVEASLSRARVTNFPERGLLQAYRTPPPAASTCKGGEEG